MSQTSKEAARTTKPAERGSGGASTATDAAGGDAGDDEDDSDDEEDEDFNPEVRVCVCVRALHSVIEPVGLTCIL